MPRVTSPVALLINLDTGRILYEKNIHSVHPLPSITKIVSVICAIESGVDWEKKIKADADSLHTLSKKVKVARGYKIPPYWLSLDGTSWGIQVGEELSVKDLLHAAMLVSANEASNLLGMAVDGNIPQFVDRMNAFAKKIGCSNTYFCNPHGLFFPGHQSTAYDMALITRHALQNPLFTKVISTREYAHNKSNKREAGIIKNTNPLLRPGSRYYYPAAFGGKTGYHIDGGFTCVVGADNGERRLLAVVMQGKESSQRFRDIISLFDAAFAEKKQVRALFRARETQFKRVVSGAKSPVTAGISEDIELSYYPSEEPECSAQIQWKALQMPLKEGMEAGFLEVMEKKGGLLRRVPLYISKTPTPTAWFALVFWIKQWWWMVLIVLAIFLWMTLGKRSQPLKNIY